MTAGRGDPDPATIPLFATMQFEAMGLRSYVYYARQIKERNGH
ncbi:hypothetical protein SAMN05216359_10878 [Roseateles sp. YR242]|nr:hypothetical protein [Roseateles sp. YR242]SEL37393.1 hypothetical protein SAMN05216359_10878 [Roseateles sp. YR242]